MTAKDKAVELVYKYSNFVSGWTTTNRPEESPSAQYEGLEMKKGRAKQCALIAVVEILEALSAFGYSMTMYDDFETGDIITTDVKPPYLFWQEVKQEIEKL